MSAELDVYSGFLCSHQVLPKFNRSTEHESKHILQRIVDLLDDRLTHLDEARIREIHDKVRLQNKVSYEDNVNLIRKLWDLHLREGIEFSLSMSILGVLSIVFKRLVSTNLTPLWLKTSSKSCYRTQDELNVVADIVDWEVLYSYISSYIKKDCFSNLNTSWTQCETQITEVVNLARLGSKIWDSRAVGEKLSAILDWDNTDMSSFDCYYKIYIMSLFVGPGYWFDSLQNGKFFEWWNPTGTFTSQALDTCFVSLLYRGLKYGWCRNLEFNFESYNTLILQLLSDSLKLSVVSRVKLPKEKPPPIYSAITPKTDDCCTEFGKVCSLLLSFERSSAFWLGISRLFALLSTKSHSANSNVWSPFVATFVSSLVSSYTRRVVRERTSTSLLAETFSESKFLTSEHDKLVVSIALPVVLQGLHNRNRTQGVRYERTLNGLCALTPQLVLSSVVPKVVKVLESVTDTLKLESSFRVLTPLIPVILQHQPEVFPELWSLSLPGIDGNDPFKSVQVLFLFAIAYMHFPCKGFFELNLTDDLITKISKQSMEAMHSSLKSECASPVFSVSNCADVDFATCPWTPERLRYRWEVYCNISMQMEGWSDEIMECLLRLVGSCSKIEKNSAAQRTLVDQSVGTAAQILLNELLGSCSPRVAVSLCNMLCSWIENTFNMDIYKQGVLLCHVFVYNRPTICVEPLLKCLLGKLAPHPDHIPIGVALWYLHCLSGALRCPSQYLSHHEDKLWSICEWAIYHPKKEVAKLGSKVIRRIIETSLMTNIARSDPSTNDEEAICALLSLGVPWWVKYSESLRQLESSTNMEDDKLLENLQIHYNVPTLASVEFVSPFLSLMWYHIIQLLKRIKDSEELLTDAIKYEEMLINSCPRLKNLPDLPEHIKKMSKGKLIQKVTSLGRHLLKAVAFVSDGLPRVSPGVPIVSPIDFLLGNEFNKFMELITFKLYECAFDLSTDGLLREGPGTLSSQGREEYVIKRKFISLIHQLISKEFSCCRLISQKGEDASLWNLFGPWLSPLPSIHGEVDQSVLTRNSWMEQILGFIYQRIVSRRLGQNEVNPKLLLLLILMSMDNYADNRILCQKIISNCVLDSHPTCFKYVINELIQTMTSTSEKLSMLSVGPEELNDTTQVAEETRLHAIISGASFTLDNSKIIGRIWGNQDCLVSTLMAMYQVTKAPISRDAIRSRVMSTFRKIVQSRIKNYQMVEFEKQLSGPILNELIGSRMHWRVQMIGTIIIALFPTSNEEAYIKWLMTCLTPGYSDPMLGKLALYVLSAHLSKVAKNDDPPVYPSLLESSFISKAVTCLSTATADTNDMRVHLYDDLAKTPCRWPTYRRHKTNIINTTSCEVLSTIISYQRATTNLDYLNSWLECTLSLLHEVPLEITSQRAISEIMCGIATTVFKLPTVPETIWENFSRCLSQCAKILNVKFYGCLIEGLLLATTNKCNIIPLINCALGFPTYDSTKLHLENLATMSCETLELSRIIKLIAARLEGHAEVLTEQLLPQLPVLINEPSTQVREEISKLIVALCGIRQLAPLMDIRLTSIAESVQFDVSQISPVIHTLRMVVVTLIKENMESQYYKTVLAVVKLLFESIQSSEDEVVEVSLEAIDYIGYVTYRHDNELFLDYVKCLVSVAEAQAESIYWRTRRTAVAFSCTIADKLRQFLHQTHSMQRFLNICIKQLSDKQSEVRAGAILGISQLAASLNESELNDLFQEFVASAGDPFTNTNPENAVQLTAGVMGLIGLVESSPHDVPFWLPRVVGELAKYGNAKMSYNIRREVQIALQQFVKSHQDNWEEHSLLFTSDQLEALSLYKGRPSYFS